MPRLLYLLCFSVLSLNVWAEGLKLKGEMTQGSLIRGQVSAGHQVWLNDMPLKISVDGYFAFGFGRDAKLTQQRQPRRQRPAR